MGKQELVSSLTKATDHRSLHARVPFMLMLMLNVVEAAHVLRVSRTSAYKLAEE